MAELKVFLTSKYVNGSQNLESRRGKPRNGTEGKEQWTKNESWDTTRLRFWQKKQETWKKQRRNGEKKGYINKIVT